MNMAKIKYADLEKEFGQLKVDPATDKFVVLFDLSYHIGVLESFTMDKDHPEIKPLSSDEELSEEFAVRIVYHLLNNVAHYRHFIFSKLKCGNVIVIYSSDPKLYVKYPNLFKRIEKLLNLFKKTIFIEKLDDNVNFIYQHMAYFTAMNLMGINNSAKKKTRIIYIGSNYLASQLLRIDRNTIFISHKSFQSGMDFFFGTRKIENTPTGYRDANLITSVLALCGVPGIYHKLESLRGLKYQLLYHIIKTNCANFVDKDNPTNITNGLYLSANDEGFFKARLQALDVDFHDKIYSLSKSMMNVWSSKIHTNQVYNINEHFRLNDLNLNVAWLGEG